MLPNHYHGYGYPFQPCISATVFYPCQIYIFLSFALNLDIHLIPCKVFNCVLGNWTDLLHYIHYNNWPYRYKNQILHPSNGPFSGTTWVSRYQWHQLGHMQVCTSHQADNHASTPPLMFFTGRMPFLPPNQQCQSTEGTKRYKNRLY